MSLLAKIDALQQEMWSLCDVDEDTPETDKEVRQIMKNLLELYEPLARVFHPVGSKTHNLVEMVLLCGINDENLGENSALRPK
jgi:hypothetical protein